MSEAGSYIPKFKVGQTVTWDDAYPGRQFIIFSTYRGMDRFTRTVECPSEFNEHDADSTMYVIWDIDHANYYWMNERNGELYCSNCNRGKKELLRTKALGRMAIWFDFTREGIQKFTEMLEHQPPEDE